MGNSIKDKFIAKHGSRYDYSKVEYINAKTKVTVICKEHGEFLITPNNHLSGYGCAKCAGKGFSAEERLAEFIHKARQVHGEKYDYSLVNATQKKVEIICPDHGVFSQDRINHTTGKKWVSFLFC